jgi:hypothetical protein
MSLSRKQITYGTILTLAAGGFIWDRLTSGGPRSAPSAASDLLIQPSSALKPAAPARSTPAGPDGSSSQAAAPADAPTLRDRLTAVAAVNQLQPGDAANAFALQDGWLPKKAVVPDPVVIKPTTPAPDPDQKLAEAFRKHHLDGIVVAANRPSYAIVDHNIVYVGQTYRQFTLLSVTKTTALFTLRDTRVELRLPGSESPNAGNSDRADVTENP